MQDNHVFEYAVVRIVPRIEREEFLNVGVILYCRNQSFLQTIIGIDEERIRAFAGNTDLTELRKHLSAFENICHGNKDAGPIAQLDKASRFRWLTATRSTTVQTSKVHPGLCIADAATTLQRLYQEMVL